jgi:hypothetical protein
MRTLREDFRPDSDLDLLVRFAPEADPSLLDHVAMEEELSGIVGRKVDLRFPARDRAQLKLDSAQGHPGERGAVLCHAILRGRHALRDMIQVDLPYASDRHSG